jgi:hypothetical protein
MCTCLCHIIGVQTNKTDPLNKCLPELIFFSWNGICNDTHMWYVDNHMPIHTYIHTYYVSIGVHVRYMVYLYRYNNFKTKDCSGSSVLSRYAFAVHHTITACTYITCLFACVCLADSIVRIRSVDVSIVPTKNARTPNSCNHITRYRLYSPDKY